VGLGLDLLLNVVHEADRRLVEVGLVLRFLNDGFDQTVLDAGQLLVR